MGRSRSERRNGPDDAESRKETLPIFLDPTRHRLILFRSLTIVVLILGLVWLATFALSIYYVGKLPRPAGPAANAEAGSLASVARLSGGSGSERTIIDVRVCGGGPEKTPGGSLALPSSPAKLYTFLSNEFDLAPGSLRGDCGPIDVVLPEWYVITPHKGGALRPLRDAMEIASWMAGMRSGPDPAEIMPVVTLPYAEAVGRAGFLTQASTRSRIAENVADLVHDGAFPGICVMPLGLPGDAQDIFLELFVQISSRLSADGRKTCLVLKAESPLWRRPEVIEAAGLVVLLAFTEPTAGSSPAPLAPQAWFERTVSEAIAAVGAEKLVVALGNHSYDWVSGDVEPERIAYAEAMRRAARYGARISLHPDVLNTTIELADDDGRRHEIWLLDAVSVFDQLTFLHTVHPSGIALWSWGLEDPGSWRALTGGMPYQMEAVSLDEYAGHDGAGPFLRVTQTPNAGHRALGRDALSGLIVRQIYTEVPQPFSIEHYGAAADDMVALTFDDGPDPKYTPAILDILRDENVPAAFFLIGSQILDTPGTVQRMVAEGHEIGSHTFFHPEIEAIPELRQKLELNALQRLLVSLTGRSTILFRTPYGRSEGPLSSAEAQPFLTLGDSGYVVAGGTVVPPDWKGLKAGEIVAAAMVQMKPSGGNVIVLHDGGGDRSATVAALRILIHELRAKGYRFVPLATLLGLDRDAVMPAEQGARAAFDAYSFALIGQTGPILKGIFWVAVILGSIRALVILTLALLRRHYPIVGPPYLPTVTVVIPAFNEEKVILRSIDTVLGSDYPDLKLIVVDDGSQDRTGDCVREAYADDPRVEVVREVNRGKWMALDTAYARIDTEVVVAIDADTIVRPDAIRHLVRAFRDPNVGAVAGKVLVGNRGRLLTKLQALEYITAQNIDRRAAEMFNGMLVVPGAIGAWRAAAVRSAGLYTHDTVAEDADLTVSVLRAGYRIVFEEKAISVTEAPETVRAFMKQRLRWTFGMMQTGWKHAHAAREGRAVGLISIPDLWLFGVVLALLAPVADLVFLGVVTDIAMNAFLGRPLMDAPGSWPLIASYLALPLIEVLSALVAFGFERKSPALVLLIPVQKLFYRQLLYITVYRAAWRALTGTLAEWGKLARLGTIRIPGK